MNRLQFPPTLQAGDKVIIVSPSSKIDRHLVKGATTVLESWGLKVEWSKHVTSSYASFAGTIRQRADDFQKALDDDEAKVIFCSRGGYGAVHLLDKLNFTRFREHPKWLIGFSDITALHNLFQQQGFASMHAPMARHLTVEPDDDYAKQALKDILFGHFSKESAEAVIPEKNGFSYICPKHRLNRQGVASGTLRGGNLAVFHGLRGTPYDLMPDHTILFIEDVGERPHAIERMMYNLKLGGFFDKIQGLIIGQFTEFEENKALGKELYGALADLLEGYDFPVCFNFPVGHITNNLPLINGAAVTLHVSSKDVRLQFNIQDKDEKQL